ncbi:hypothetical protein PV11_08898 [Exophiala sideris]|uniref:Clr5 domain-containing protein n=1 Tax=Exophiala sideris TaxID=1016849 RepID=A0A0D1Y2F6_9EURO|nr:hypothetical protein PV11_08898 [Exophiala sideris]
MSKRVLTIALNLSVATCRLPHENLYTMSRTRQSKPSGLKIIKQNGRTSGYNGRLSEEELDRIKPLLQHLHQTDATRAQMVAEVNIRHGLVITLPQLDGIRTKFGLTTQMNRPRAAPVEPNPWQEQSPILQPSHPIHAEPDLSPVPNFFKTDEDLERDRLEPLSQENVSATEGAPDIDAEQMAPLSIPCRTSVGTTTASLTPTGELQNKLPRAYLDTCSIATSSGISKAPRGDDQPICRRFHAAFILHALRALDQAFDMFFHIFIDLHAQWSDTSIPDSRLALTVVNCARSARTQLQLQVVRVLLEEVPFILTQHYGYMTEASHSWYHLERLREQLLEHSVPNAPLFYESVGETAHWLVISCRLSQHEGRMAPFTRDLDYWCFPDLDPLHQHFYRCIALWSTIVNSLDDLIDLIDRHSTVFANVLTKLCPSESKDLSECSIAPQAIACMFLDYKLRKRASSIAPQRPLPPCAQVPGRQSSTCELNGLVPVALPHVLAQIVQEFDISVPSGSSTPDMLPSSRFIWQLRAAAILLTSKLQDFHENHGFHSRSSYFSVVNLFLHQTEPFRGSILEGAYVDKDQSKFHGEMIAIATKVSKLLPVDNVHLADCTEIPGAPCTDGFAHIDTPLGVLDLPTLGQRSPRSSISSDWRSFRATSTNALNARRSVAPSEHSLRTTSSGAGSSRGDWSFSAVTGLPSGPSTRQNPLTKLPSMHSEQESVRSTLSDVPMSG